MTSNKGVEMLWQPFYQLPSMCQTVRRLRALNPMLVLEDKDKSTMKLTNEVFTETERFDEFVCGSILHEFSNMFDQMLKDK